MPKLVGKGGKTETALSGSPVRLALLIFALTMLFFIIMAIVAGADRAAEAIGYGFLTAVIVSLIAGGIGCLSSRTGVLGYAVILVTLFAAVHFLDDDSPLNSGATPAARVTVVLVVILCAVGVTLAAAVWGWYKYLVLARRGEGGRGSDEEHDPAPPPS